MRILIATGIYPPDIGGPAHYARGVEEAWRRQGHQVKVLAFSALRRTGALNWKLPTGIRHLYYFFRVLFSLLEVDPVRSREGTQRASASNGVNFVFSPDTFSAAIPALFAAKLCGKKLIIRTGGDFLWEQYVERTGDLVLLRNFYEAQMNADVKTADARRLQTRMEWFNLKERIIFRLIRFLFRHAGSIIFSTVWQRDIFEKPYSLNLGKCFIVENCYATPVTHKEHTDKLENVGVLRKVFVGGTRELRWKNIPLLRRALALAKARRHEIVLDTEPASRGEFLEKMRSAYAVILVSLGDISPNMILDAVAFGKPFILTRETGLYEKLKDIGVWVNPEDVNDIAEKIAWLADERNYAEQCRKVAAFSFMHSYEEIASEISEIYHRLYTQEIR